MPENIVAKIEDIGVKGRAYGIVPRPEPAFSPEEKSEQLWGLFNEYSTFRRKFYKDTLRSKLGERKITELTVEERDTTRKELAENPLTQRLEGEISRLWQDPQVRSVFQTKLKEAIAEQEFHTPNLSSYRELQERYHRLQDEYFDLMRNQFLLRQMTPTLRGIERARNRTERSSVEQNIAALEGNGGMLSDLVATRGGLDREHADLAALLNFEKIKDYHRQYRTSGVVFTPSRERLFEDTVGEISSGTWMLFTGETGTGKSTFGKRTSFILNGEPPQYASGEERGDVTRLIGTKSMTREGKTYYEFGPLIVAATGCRNSLEMEEVLRSGRQSDGKLLLLDEINKFSQDALFGALKVIATLKPGEEFNFKELPGIKLKMAHRGFGFIATRNPNSERYERKELDPAIARLVKDGERKVDYPPMTQNNPELYEIFLSILMDDNGRIRISRDEIAPVYDEKKNEAKGTISKELAGDPKRHGALYRFALASTEIHKSFSQKDSVAKTASDPGFLETTVLDMQLLANWMEKYRQEIEGGASLSTYLEKKLHDFYEKIESVNDKAIFKRVFDQFGFNIENPQSLLKPSYQVTTPAEIGYLSPRVKRPVLRIGEEAIPQTKIFVLPDATELQYLPVSVGIEKDKSLLPDSLITHNGKTIRFLGKDPVSGKVRFVNTDENLVIDLSEGEIGKLFKSGQMRIFEQPKVEPVITGVNIESAQRLFGENFLGPRQVEKGLDIKINDKDIPAIPFTEEELREAKDRGEILILFCDKSLQGQAITMEYMDRHLKTQFEKDQKGKILYNTDWYKSEDFFTKDTPKLRWRLVSTELLSESLNKNYLQQTEILADYVRKTIFRNKKLPAEYQTALKEFEDQKASIAQLIGNNWQEAAKKLGGLRAAKKLGGLKLTQLLRNTPSEWMYTSLVYFQNTGKRLLPNAVTWTSSRSSSGSLVCVGGFGSVGLSVGDDDPGGSNYYLGVCPSR